MAGFRFIDLFAGIGGTRLGFEDAGGECVFTSEWDKFARQTYDANFGSEGHLFNGDITKWDAGDTPDHDIAIGGFPCQPFSIAGVSVNNALGRKHGFAHATQGTLFYDVVRILREKQPQAFMLENVKNLKSHNKGKTFEVIKGAIAELGYHMTWRVIDGNHWVPQHRERLVMVGFREPNDFDINDLILPTYDGVVGDILEDVVDPKYTLRDGTWRSLQNHAAKHAAKGNGFGYGLVNRETRRTKTLSARYYKDGSEILVEQPGRNPRRLTPNECRRLMGFPEGFVIPVSDTQAYRQFGNGIIVPMVAFIARAMRPYLDRRW